MNYVHEQIAKKAINGDASAMNEISKHYAHYIKKLSLETVYYDDGRVENAVNPELESLLHSHLAEAVLKFKFF